MDNPRHWVDVLGPDVTLDTAAWFRDRLKRSRVGTGVLILEMRDGGRPGYRARHAPPPPPPEPEPCSLTAELDQAFGPVAVRLRQAVGESTFEIWLASLHPHDYDEGWVLGCPASRVAWVERRFGRVLESVCGELVRVVPCKKEERL